MNTDKTNDNGQWPYFLPVNQMDVLDAIFNNIEPPSEPEPSHTGCPFGYADCTFGEYQGSCVCPF